MPYTDYHRITMNSNLYQWLNVNVHRFSTKKYMVCVLIWILILVFYYLYESSLCL